MQFYIINLTREEHMGCEFCHTVVLSADNLTATMEAGEGRTMVSCLGLATMLLLPCDVIQMVGRGEEGEGEGLTLAQFMGSYYR